VKKSRNLQRRAKHGITSDVHVKLLIRSFANCNVKEKTKKRKRTLDLVRRIKGWKGIKVCVPSPQMRVAKERSSGNDQRNIAVMKLINSKSSLQTKIKELKIKSSKKKINPIYRSNRSSGTREGNNSSSSMER
jgi:ribosome biogenesis protein Tsr3